ncbi:VCBS domain-containing protein [Vibrio comitans]|uniref:VCBS domain-containing protein n=1 Tax=Vibrio comitans TaxID=413401 RepID=UPI0035E514AB
MTNEDKNKQATEVSRKSRELKKARKARRFVIPRVYVPRPSTVAFVLPSYHVGSTSAEEGLESEISHTEYAGNPQHEAYTPTDVEGNHTVHPEPTPYIAGGDYEPPHHTENKGNHHFTHEHHYGKPVTSVTGTSTSNFGHSGVTPVPVIASHTGDHKDYSYLTPPVVGAPESGTVVEDTTLAVSGTVDIHSAQKGAPLTFSPDNLHGQYGEFTLNKDTGEWSYSLDNSHHQNLAQGETHTEILHVTVTSAAGVSVHQDITVTVEGTNDIPTITSQAQHESTKEDGVLFVKGQVTASDVDHGASLTYIAGQTQGQYGQFTLDSTSGQWSYTLDNNGNQALSEGEHHTETMLVTVTDEHGASTHQEVTVVVEGTNDLPTIDVILAQKATEDGTIVHSQVYASDVDTLDSLTFQTSANVPGFTLNSDGTYSFDPSHQAYQHLAEGQKQTISIPVTVSDPHGGSQTKDLVITVTGTNDNPVLAVSQTDSASGRLSQTDVDDGDTHTFTIIDHNSQVPFAKGQFGDLYVDEKTGIYTYVPHVSVAGMNYDPATHKYSGQEYFHVQVSDNHGGTDDNYLTFEVEATASAPLHPGGPAVITPKVVTPSVPQISIGVPPLKPAHPPQNSVTIDLSSSSDTGSSNTDDLTKDTTPEISGHTSIPFSVVTIYDSGREVAKVTSDQNGDYHVDTSSLSGTEGGLVHHLVASAVAPSGTTANSVSSSNLDVTIDTGVTATDGANTATEDQSGVVSGQLNLATDAGGTAEVTTTGDIAGKYGTYHLKADGTYTYTLDNTKPEVQAFAAGTQHQDPISYSVTDAAGNTAQAKLTVTIAGTNDNPVLSVAVQSVSQGGLTETDVDTGDTHTFEILDGTNPVQTIHGQFGDLVLDKDSGQYVYTPHAGVQGMGYDPKTHEYRGHEYFHVQVSDNHGGTDDKYVTFEVAGTVGQPTQPGGPGVITMKVVPPTNPIGTGTSTPLQQVTDTAPQLKPFQAPPANTVTIDLTDGSDTGKSHTDDLTSDTTPTVTGTTVLPYSVVTIYDHGKPVATVTSDGNGDYTATLPTMIGSEQGEVHDLMAEALAPSQGSAHKTSSSNLDVTIDTGVTATDGTNTATEDQSGVVSGQLNLATDAGGTAEVTTTGDIAGKYGTYHLKADGTYTYTLDNTKPEVQAFAAGTQHQDPISYSVTDAAGNTAQAKLTVTIAGTNDNPVLSVAVQSVSQGGLTETDVDTGDTHTFEILDGTNPVQTIHGQFGDLVLDKDSGQYVYTPHAGVQGMGYDPKTHEYRGHEYFHVQVSDNHGGTDDKYVTFEVAGTVGQPTQPGGPGVITMKVVPPTNPIGTGTSTPLQQVTDTAPQLNPFQAPPANTVTLTLDPVSDTGVQGDLRTSDQTPTLTGTTALPFSVVVIYDHGTEVAKITSDKDGHYSVDSSLLSGTDGGIEHYLTAVAQAPNSNSQVGSPTLTLRVDTGVTTHDLDTPLQEDLLTVTSGQVSVQGDAHVTSTTVHGKYGDYEFKPDGSFTYTLHNSDGQVQAFAAGSKHPDPVTFEVLDTAGNKTFGTVTAIIEGTNDNPVLAVVQTDNTKGHLTETDVDTPDTHTYQIVDAGTNVQSIHGTFGDLTLDPTTGQYVYTPHQSVAGMALINGKYQGQDVFEVQVTDDHGGTDQKYITFNPVGTLTQPTPGGTPVLTVQVPTVPQVTDTRPPVAQLTPPTNAVDIDLTDGSDSAQPSNLGTGTDTDDLTNDVTPTIAGTATVPFSKIEILENGKVIASTYADDKGAYSVTLPTQSEGIHNYVAHATAPDAPSAVDSTPLPVEVDTTAPAISIDPISTDNVVNAAEHKQALTISGVTDAEVGQVVTVHMGPANAGHDYTVTVTAGSGGQNTFTLDIPPSDVGALADGQHYPVSASVIDKAGNPSNTATSDVVVDLTSTQVINGQHGSVVEDTQPSTSLTLTVPNGESVTWDASQPQVGNLGELTFDETTGTWTYNLDHGKADYLQQGEKATPEQFTVTGTDAQGNPVTQQITVGITGTNDAPVLTVTPGAVQPTTSIGQLSETDVDLKDSHTYSIVGSANGQFGDLALDPASGQYTYTPKASVAGMTLDKSTGEYTGHEYFEVQVDDGHGGTDTKYIEFETHATLTPGTNGGAPQIHVTVPKVPTVTDTAPQITNTPPANSVTMDLATASDSGHSDSDKVTNEQTPTIQGDTGIPFSKVEIRDGSKVVATTYSDAHGHYSVPTSQLEDNQRNPEGQNHHLVATATAPSTSSGVTAVLDVRVDTLAHATDDMDSVTEDTRLTTNGDLLSNDESHSTLESVATGSGGSHPTGGGTVTVQGQYGTFTVNPDGTYTYKLDNGNAAVQALQQGAHLDEVLTYHVTDLAGNPVQAQLKVIINGHNDGAVIGGANTGAVTEDINPQAGKLVTQGDLTITDVDKTPVDEAYFQTVVTPKNNPWGHLTIDKNGHWSYEVDNQGNVQTLQQGATHIDTFTVKAADGTEQDITVTITGTKDAPVITEAAETGSVIEVGTTNTGQAIPGTAQATGQFHSTDVDVLDTPDAATWSVVAGQTQTQTNAGEVQGTYGHLEINQNGHWTYVLGNHLPATEALNQGDTEQETFTVRVTDSTGLTVEQTVAVNVHGSNDQAHIAGTDTGSVKEDNDVGGKLSTTGTLTVSDVDTGEEHFTASTQTGTYGQLVLNEHGVWTYTADNSQQAIQELKASDHLTDTFTVTSADGTEHTVTVTIDGTNDLPTIDHKHDTGAVKEAGSSADAQHAVTVDAGKQTARGRLVPHDIDTGDTAHWAVTNGHGAYGSLHINPRNGRWTYTLDNQKANSLHEGEVKTETFVVTDTDSSKTPVPHTVTITVTGSNDMPVITGSDSGKVTEAGGEANAKVGTPTIAGTLDAADPDNNDGTLKWSVEGASSGTTVKEGTYGTFTIDQSGHWQYQLDNQRAATQALQHTQKDRVETFTVLVTDSSNNPVEKVVTVSVHGDNDNPVLSSYQDEKFAEGSGDHTIVMPGATDVDDTDSSLTYALGQHPSWVSIDPHTGVITVRTNDDELDKLSVGEVFTQDIVVTVEDSHGGRDHKTLHLTIEGTNDRPSIRELLTEDSTGSLHHSQDIHGRVGSVTTDEDSQVQGVVTFKDVDNAYDTQHPHGDTHSFTAVVEYEDQNHVKHQLSLSESGFSIDNQGHFTFDATQPIYQSLQKGQLGHLLVKVTVHDNHGAIDTQQLMFNVRGQNDEPTATQVHPMQVDEDKHLRFTLGAAANDPWGKPLVTVTDVENDRLDISNPHVDSTYGRLVDHGMGRFEFIPNKNWNSDGGRGDVPITFDIDDNHGGKVHKQGLIYVNPVNDAPVAGHVTLRRVNEDSGVIHFTEADLLKNSHDIDNPDSDLHIQGQLTLNDPNAGTLTGNAQQGWTFTPAKDWNSHKAGHNLVFGFTVSDGAGGTSHTTATQRVNPIQDPAIITDDGNQLQDKIATTGSTDGLKAEGYLNIVDPDLNEDHFQVVSTIPAGHGYATIDSQGHWVYHLNPKDPDVLALGQGETMPDTFIVHGADGTPHTVTVTIEGQNEAPIILGADKLVAVEDGKTVTGHVHVHDPDTSDTLSYSLVKGQNPIPGFTLNSDGSYSLDPTNAAYQHLSAGAKQDMTVEVEVTDGNGGTSKQTIQLEVIGSNDAPLATGMPLPNLYLDDQQGHKVPVPSQHFVDDDFLKRAIDIDDGDKLTIGRLTAGINGQQQLSDVRLHDPNVGKLVQDGHGGYDFTPANGFEGTVEIDYTVSDGHQSVQLHTTFDVTRHAPTPINQGTPTLPSTSTSTNTQNNQQPNTKPPVQPPWHDDYDAHTPGAIDEDGTTSTGHVNFHRFNPQNQDLGDNFDVYGANHKDPEPHSDGSKPYGYLTVSPDGTWTYHLLPHTRDNDPVNQLAVGETLKEEFVINSDYGQTTVTVVINGSNDDPVITGNVQNVANNPGVTTSTTGTGANSGSIAEVDTTHIEGTMTATDVDHGDTLTFSAGEVKSGVASQFLDANHHLKGLVVNPDGTYTFTPDSAVYGSIPPGQTQTFRVPVVVSDGHGGTDTEIIELSVRGHNRPPIIDHPNIQVADQTEDFGTITLTKQQLVTRAGAHDPDGDAMRVQHVTVTDSQGGIITARDDGHGNFVFTSKLNQHGVVHVTYEITDGMSQPQTVHATLTVTAVNDVPVAHGFTLPGVDESTTNAPKPSAVFTEQDFLAHVTDPDIATDQDVLHLVGDPELTPTDRANGHIEAHGNGWRFVPNDPNFNGVVHIQYTVADKAGATAQATATLEVKATNDPAIIDNPVVHHVVEDGIATTEGDLTIHDVDGPNQELFHANSHINGQYGYLELNDQGHYRYVMTRGDRPGVQQLSEGGKLTETFQVTSKDGTHYDLKVEVHGTNDNPVLSTIHSAAGKEGGSQLSGQVHATDVDTEGTRTADNPADVLSYNTQYTHSGFHLDTATGAYTLDLTDPSFDHLSQGDTETLTIPVTVTDNHAGSSQTKNLVITVTGTNDVPVLDKIAEISKNEDDGVVHGRFTSTDKDDDNQQGQLTTYHQQGAVVPGFHLKDDGTYTFDPNIYNNLQAGETKDIEIPIIARDNHGDSAPQKLVIHLTGTNDAATISGTSHTTVTDGPSISATTTTQSEQLQVSDPDHDQDSFTASQNIAPDNTQAGTGLQQTAYGHLSITADGHWQYHVDSPDAIKAIPDGQTVTETFTVESVDGTTHKVSVDIVGTNNAAVITGTVAGDVTEDQINGMQWLLFSGHMNVVDPDVSESKFDPVYPAQNYAGIGYDTALGGHVNVTPDGDWTYQLDNNNAKVQSLGEGETFIDKVTIHTVDGTTQELQITIHGTNDRPTVSGALTLSGHGTEDQDLTIAKADLLANASDVDTTDVLHIENPSVAASAGTVSLDKSGSLVFHPASNFSGDVTVTYEVVDSHGAKATATATFTVDPVNDTGVFSGDTSGDVQEDVKVQGNATKTVFTTGVLNVADPDVGEGHFVENHNVRAVHDPYGGSLSIGKAGDWTYSVPNANIQALGEGETAVVTYRVKSAGGDTQDISITITGTNDAPTISHALVKRTDEDTDLSFRKSYFGFQDMDSSDKLSEVTITSVPDASHGQLLLNGQAVSNGQSIAATDINHLVFHPASNFNGDAHFDYKVSDGHAESGVQTATLHVTAVNDAAVVTQTPSHLSEHASVSQTGVTTAGMLTIHDPDAGEDKFVAQNGLVGKYGTLDIDEHGSWSYRYNPGHTSIMGLKANQHVDEVIAVTTEDGTKFDIHIQISGDNDKPTVTLVSPVAENGINQHQFSESDFGYQDADNDALNHITIASLPDATLGTLKLNGHDVTQGQDISRTDLAHLVFENATGVHNNQTASFSFTANDGHVDSDPATMTVALHQPMPAPPPPPVSAADEPMQDTPVETITLEALASNQDAHTGAQAYLNQLGINEPQHQSGAHSLPQDLDLILNSDNAPVLDDHGLVVADASGADGSSTDDDHKHHDELHLHDDPAVDHHDWTDNHG